MPQQSQVPTGIYYVIRPTVWSSFNFLRSACCTVQQVQPYSTCSKFPMQVGIQVEQHFSCLEQTDQFAASIADCSCGLVPGAVQLALCAAL